MMREDDNDRAARRPAARAGVALLAVCIFAGLTLLFIHLLRPLAHPEGQAPSPALAATTPSTSASNAPPPSPQTVTQTAVAVPEATASRPAGPLVAVLVTELGADREQSLRSIKALPSAFGFAFLPAARETPALAQAARDDGHEIWIGLPMQPRNWPKITPGPNTMLTSDNAETLIAKLDWALGRINQPDGAYTMMGSAFTVSRPSMNIVAEALSRRKLLLLDSRSTAKTLAAQAVKQAGGQALTNAVFIDSDTDADAIRRALNRLTAEAKRTGQAIGIARPLPATLTSLKDWTESLEAKGVTLVPPTMLAEK